MDVTADGASVGTSGKPAIEATQSEVLARARAFMPNLLNPQPAPIDDKGDPLVTICDSDDDTSSESESSSDDEGGKTTENTPGCKVQMEIAFIPWEEDEESSQNQDTAQDVKPPLIREINEHESISEKPL